MIIVIVLDKQKGVVVDVVQLDTSDAPDVSGVVNTVVVTPDTHDIVPDVAPEAAPDVAPEAVPDVAPVRVSPLPAYSAPLGFGTLYDDLINTSADYYGLDPVLLFKLLKAESNFIPEIITGARKSPVGAIGIAQFMPATAVDELGSVEAALNPAVAIPGAAKYLAKLIKSTGSVVKGVAAYNWGVGNVKRQGLDKAPAETVAYVKKITGVNIA